VPAVDLFFGLIPWYFMTMHYILIHSTALAKASRVWKIVLVSILTSLFVEFIILASVLPLASIIG